MGRNAQLDPAVFAGDPEATLVDVGVELAAGGIVGVRDVVTALHALAGDLTNAAHDVPRYRWLRPWPGRNRPRCDGHGRKICSEPAKYAPKSPSRSILSGSCSACRLPHRGGVCPGRPGVAAPADSGSTGRPSMAGLLRKPAPRHRQASDPTAATRREERSIRGCLRRSATRSADRASCFSTPIHCAEFPARCWAAAGVGVAQEVGHGWPTGRH